MLHEYQTIIEIAPWELELPLPRPLLSERGDDLSVDVEDLDPVVVGVGDDDAVGVADGDVVRVLKVAGAGAHLAELAHEGAVGLENLPKEKYTLVNNKLSRVSISAMGKFYLRNAGLRAM